MIRISMNRVNSGDRIVYKDREKETISALGMLIHGELSDGGIITEATGTRLTVVTRFFACVDTSIFEGSDEEMRVLHEAAYYYLQGCPEQDTVMKGVLADLERMPCRRDRIPLIINMSAPSRRNRLALAAMLALGITEESEIAAGMLLGLENLFAAYQLTQEFPGMSLAEVSAATAV